MFKQIISKLSKQQYDHSLDPQLLLQTIESQLLLLTQQKTLSNFQIFEFQKAFLNLFRLGLNTKATLYEFVETISKYDQQTYQFSTYFTDSCNQFNLDLYQQNNDFDIKQPLVLNLYIRYLLKNNQLTIFLNIAFKTQNLLKSAFYDEKSDQSLLFNDSLFNKVVDLTSSVFVNPEQIQILSKIETDKRIFLQLDGVLLSKYNDLQLLLEELPESSFTYQDGSKQIQGFLLECLFGEMDYEYAMGLLVDFMSLIQQIIKQNQLEAQFQLFGQICQFVPSIEQLNDFVSQIQQLRDFITKQIKTKLCFGLFQQKLQLIRFLLEDYKLLSLFIAYLASILDSNKYDTNQRIIKYYSKNNKQNCLVQNSVFLTKMLILLQSHMNIKHIHNANNDLDNQIAGTTVFDCLINGTCNTCIQLLSNYENTYQQQLQFALFLFIELLKQLKELILNNTNITHYIKTKQVVFDNKQQLIDQLSALQLQYNERDYYVMYQLLINCQLHILFDNSQTSSGQHILQQILKIEQLLSTQRQSNSEIDEILLMYDQTQFIQKQRTLYIQITAFVLKQLINNFEQKCQCNFELLELKNYVTSLNAYYQQEFDKVENKYINTQVGQYENYFFELLNLNQIEQQFIDYLQEDFINLLDLDDKPISKQVQQLINTLKHISTSKSVTEQQMEDFQIQMIMIEQYSLTFKNNQFIYLVKEIFDKHIDTVNNQVKQQLNTKSQVQEQNQVADSIESCKYPQLRKLLNLVTEQFVEMVDQYEAFNRGLIILNVFDEFLQFFKEYFLNIRKFYGNDSLICKIKVINQICDTVAKTNLSKLNLIDGAKKLHSCKQYYIDVEVLPVLKDTIVDVDTKVLLQSEENLVLSIVCNQQSLIFNEADINLLIPNNQINALQLDDLETDEQNANNLKLQEVSISQNSQSNNESISGKNDMIDSGFEVVEVQKKEDIQQEIEVKQIEVQEKPEEIKEESSSSEPPMIQSPYVQSPPINKEVINEIKMNNPLQDQVYLLKQQKLREELAKIQRQEQMQQEKQKQELKQQEKLGQQQNMVEIQKQQSVQSFDPSTRITIPAPIPVQKEQLIKVLNVEVESQLLLSFRFLYQQLDIFKQHLQNGYCIQILSKQFNGLMLKHFFDLITYQEENYQQFLDHQQLQQQQQNTYYLCHFCNNQANIYLRDDKLIPSCKDHFDPQLDIVFALLQYKAQLPYIDKELVKNPQLQKYVFQLTELMRIIKGFYQINLCAQLNKQLQSIINLEWLNQQNSTNIKLTLIHMIDLVFPLKEIQIDSSYLNQFKQFLEDTDSQIRTISQQKPDLPMFNAFAIEPLNGGPIQTYGFALAITIMHIHQHSECYQSLCCQCNKQINGLKYSLQLFEKLLGGQKAGAVSICQCCMRLAHPGCIKQGDYCQACVNVGRK